MVSTAATAATAPIDPFEGLTDRLLHEVEGNWEDIDDILQEVDVNATQVAGSAAERGSRSVSRNRGLPVQNATGSATVGPVTQIAPSSTQMAQDSTVIQGRKRGKPKGLKDKQPRKSRKAPSATVTQAL
jgi:hypothetical protein